MPSPVRVVCAVAVLALAASPAPAETHPAPPSAEVFGRLPAIDHVALAPSGSHFAAVTHIEGKPHLAVHELDAEGRPATKYIELDVQTRIEERVHDVFWLNDETVGVALVFHSDRLGKPISETRLLALQRDLAGGAVIPRAPEGTPLNTQIAHRVLDLLPDDPDHILMALDRSGFGRELGVYRVHVRTGLATLVYAGDEFVAGYRLDLEGRVRLRFEIHEKTRDIYYRPAGRKSWKLLERRKRAEEYPFDPLAFSPDAPETLWVQRRDDAGHDEIREFDLTELRFGERVFAQPPFDVTGLRMDPYTRKPVGVTYATDAPTTHYVDPELGAVQRRIDAALPVTRNSIAGFDRGRAWFVVHADGPRFPGSYYLFSVASGELRPVGTRYPGLDPSDLCATEPIRYEARDGLSIPAYLTRPRGEGPYPLVALPHGGPTARDHLGFNFVAQFLATRGYAVLQPNFRGSSGYGADFERAGYGEWGLAMQDDLEDGARAMIEQGVADPKRLGIVGWSYGGYAALMGAVKTPDLFTCAVSGAGVTDIKRILSGRFGYKFSVKNPPSIGHLRRDREKLRDNSPINNIDAIRVPILLVHGDRDPSVPVEHSKRMAARLAKQKKPHRLVILEDGRHNLDNEENRVRFLQELETFLGQHLMSVPLSPADEQVNAP